MKKRLLFLMAILMFAPLAICQATDPGITYQSTLATGGSAYDLDISGNYAYVLDFDSGLHVIDITTPEAPEEVSSLSITQGRYIDVAGNYVYISSSTDGLEIIDISTPTSPTLVGTYSSASGDVSVSGNYAYIGDDENIKIINVATPASPTLISTYAASSVTGLVAYGDYIYFSNGIIFKVVDVYNPATPTLAGYTDIHNDSVSPIMGAFANDTYISGNYAYLAAYGAGLVIIDISNPAQMEIVGCSTTLARSYGVSVSDDYAYLVSTDLGLEVFSISNPASPSLVGADYSDTLYESQKIITSGNYAYLAANGFGFRTLDISDPNSVALLSTTHFAGTTGNPFIVNDYLYVNDAQSGLHVYDLSDTLSPQLLTIYKSEVTSLFSGTNIAINDSYGLINLGQVEDTYGIVEILDLSDPANPVYGGEIHTDDYPSSLALNGHYAYIKDGINLYIYDLTSFTDTDAPYSPELLGSLEIAGGIQYIADNKLYLTSSDDDLTIIDISDQTNPTVYSTYTAGNIDSIMGFDISGNYIFMNTLNTVGDVNNYSLKVLDISDLSNPTLVSTYDFDDQVIGLEVVNDYAYVSGDNPGLQILDVSDPENLEVVATNDDFNAQYNMAIGDDGVVYIGADGLYIYTADLDGDGEVDDHSSVSSVRGRADGYIRITFGNGDSRRMEIFKDAGARSVILKRYQDTDYYFALHAKGHKLALVNVVTGEITSVRILTSDNYKYNALKIATVRGKEAAVTVSKDTVNNVLISLVQILPNLHVLKKKDQTTVVESATKVGKTKITKNKVYLRNKHNRNISRYNITKKLHLVSKAI